MEEVRDGLRPFVLGGLGMASTYRCLSERLAIAGPALRASFLPYYGQPGSYPPRFGGCQLSVSATIHALSGAALKVTLDFDTEADLHGIPNTWFRNPTTY